MVLLLKTMVIVVKLHGFSLWINWILLLNYFRSNEIISFVFTLFSFVFTLFSFILTLFSFIFTLFSFISTLFSFVFTLFSFIWTLFSPVLNRFSLLLCAAECALQSGRSGADFTARENDRVQRRAGRAPAGARTRAGAWESHGKALGKLWEFFGTILAGFEWFLNTFFWL